MKGASGCDCDRTRVVKRRGGVTVVAEDLRGHGRRAGLSANMKPRDEMFSSRLDEVRYDGVAESDKRWEAGSSIVTGRNEALKVLQSVTGRSGRMRVFQVWQCLAVSGNVSQCPFVERCVSGRGRWLGSVLRLDATYRDGRHLRRCITRSQPHFARLPASLACRSLWRP